MAEQVDNPVSGCFILDLDQPRRFAEDSEEEDDEDGDELQWLAYRDVAKVQQGRSFIQWDRPKQKTGKLIDLYSRRSSSVRGLFHLVGQWWETIMLRTKISRDKYQEPKDVHAVCYRLRDDARRFSDNVVQLFLSKIEAMYRGLDWFTKCRTEFEDYLRGKNQLNDLDLTNLEERLVDFKHNFKGELPRKEGKRPVGEDDGKKKEEKNCLHDFMIMIIDTEFYKHVKSAKIYPELLRYLPQLLPFQFKKIISLPIESLKPLATAVNEDPGILAFKPIVARKCNIIGCETSSDALKKCGLMVKVPYHVQDAICMYEYMKKETKENGHTYIYYNKILDVLGPVVEQFEEALDYLNANKVTRTQMEGGYRVVYLMTLWRSENTIARSISKLVEEDQLQPWKLTVKWDSENFESIRDDSDQLRSAQMIANQPVVAISGKGGCGKTYVVTKVVMEAKANSQMAKVNKSDKDVDMEVTADQETQCLDDMDWLTTNPCPKEINLLLTAPTGKAANLLGKRAGMPSYTLHQVIFSFRNLKEGMPWSHAEVNVLVVDECSLVSVATFAFLVELLCEHAQLRRIILLGDIRQLPSIEPGNFLEDIFQALSRISCAIELRTNHRAESQMIVDNATRLSKKMYPIFDEEKFMLRKLPESNPGETGNDYTAQDVNEEVVRLLRHPALDNHVTSQFISFTRRVCESINDLCCKRYSDHRTKDNKKFLFRVGDKVCCTRNGYVSIYEEKHGVMTCLLDDTAKDADSIQDGSQGGVDRSINTAVEKLDEGASAPTDKKKQDQMSKENQMRLCNGEIFFILEEVNKKDTKGKNRTFFHLSDKDAQKEMKFWVDRHEIRRVCKIRHAWARTIHTFQGSEAENVVYIVGGRNRHQNWQHVYTAVTRGRKTVFIVGQDSVLRQAIKRSEIKRQTSLRKQLIESFQKFLNLKSSQKIASTCSKTFTGAPDQGMIHNDTADILAALAADTDEDMEDDSEDSPSLLANVHPSQGTAKQSHISKDTVPSDLSRATLAGPSTVSAGAGPSPVSAGVGPSPVPADAGVDIAGQEAVLIEEYSSSSTDMDSSDTTDMDSDDSQSLLTTPVKSGSQQRFSNKQQSGDFLSQNRCNDLDSETDSDSDDSQSLLTNTPVKSGSQQRFSTKEQSGGDLNRNRCNKVNTHPTTGRATGHCSIWQVEKRTNKHRNDSMHTKTKSRLPVSNNVSADWTCVSTPAHPVSVRLSAGISPITPASVPADKLYKSILTPAIESTVASQQNHVPKTSSPLLPGQHCHISSGMSPLVPGFRDSLSVDNQRSLPPSRHSSFINISKSSMSPQYSVTSATSVGLTANTDRQKANGSESSWSEIDEDDYLNIDDGSQKFPNAADSRGLKNEDNREGLLAKRSEMFTSVKDKPGKCNSPLPRGMTNRSLDNGYRKNISTESQWSEVDDDQYLTLDLDDIVSMANGKECHRETHSDVVCYTKENKQKKGDTRAAKKRARKTKYVPNTPPTPVIPDTPPTLVIPDTRPQTSGHPLSPGNTRKYSAGDKRQYSAGDKQQYSGVDKHVPKRRYDKDLVTSVSPLKRSLAKLNFK